MQGKQIFTSDSKATRAEGGLNYSFHLEYFNQTKNAAKPSLFPYFLSVVSSVRIRRGRAPAGHAEPHHGHNSSQAPPAPRNRSGRGEREPGGGAVPLAPPPGAAVTPGERRAAAGAAPRLLPAPDTAGEGRDLAPPHRSGGHGPRRPRDAAAGASPLPRPRRGIAPSPPPPALPAPLPGPAGGRPRFPPAPSPAAPRPVPPPPRGRPPRRGTGRGRRGRRGPCGTAAAPGSSPWLRRAARRRRTHVCAPAQAQPGPAGGEPPATEPPRAGRASRRARRASDAPPVLSDTGVTYPGVPVSPAPAASSRAPGDIGGYSGCFPRSKNLKRGKR